MKTILRVLSMAVLALLFTLSLTSCEVIGNIFEAGAWTGAVLVIVGIGVVIWLVSKLFGGGGRSA